MLRTANAGAPPPAPRPFRFRALDAATVALLLVGTIWTIVGAIIGTALTLAAGPFWDDLILNRRSAPAEAMPTAVERKSTRVNGHPVFRVAYTFVDADGVPRSSSTVTTNRLIVVRARGNLPLQIQYDPRSPARTRISGERASAVGLGGLLPFGIGLAGCVLFLIGGRRALQLRDIYIHGEAAQATVVGTKATAMRVNWQRVMRVDYTFETIMGQTPGRTTSRSPPPVGSKIWILYDPSDPKRNVAAS